MLASAAVTWASIAATALVQYVALPVSWPISAAFHAENPQMSAPPTHWSTWALNRVAAGVGAASAADSRARLGVR